MSEEKVEGTEIDEQVLKKFEDATPPKRGRGRPRKNPPGNESPEASGAEDESTKNEGTENEDTENGDTQSSRGVNDDEDADAGDETEVDFSIIAQGVQILGEIVKSQTETQERLMQSQREFSTSVVDRMESYRQELSKVQNESAEKEKSRLQQDYPDVLSEISFEDLEKMDRAARESTGRHLSEEEMEDWLQRNNVLTDAPAESKAADAAENNHDKCSSSESSERILRILQEKKLGTEQLALIINGIQDGFTDEELAQLSGFSSDAEEMEQEYCRIKEGKTNGEKSGNGKS